MIPLIFFLNEFLLVLYFQISAGFLYFYKLVSGIGALVYFVDIELH